MKKSNRIRLISMAFLVYAMVILNGQSVAINTDNQLPHPSAILDISSDSLGLLMPRLTFSARTQMVGPPEGLVVYQTDGVKGIYFFRNTGWEMFAQKTYDYVPVGGIIDWLPLGQSVPKGFMICDGSTISDVESPYHNAVVPNLNGKFIKAVDALNMDIVGGSSTHNHSVNFPTYNTSFANVTHQHTASQQNIQTNSESHSHYLAAPIVSTATHNHQWSTLNSFENWRTFDSNGNGIELVNWSDGMDAAGSGNYPMAISSPGGLDQDMVFYTTNNSHSHSGASPIDFYSAFHSHTLNVPELGESANQVHNHSLSLGIRNSSSSSHVPLNIKLVKIMRIK
ncbi:MAG: hypothetical protein KDC49_10565 [Saprospiraceae bacterium]|nr:hypothetical protein [Saprospiraceae bacterium]